MKRILIVFDEVGWAFHRHALELQKRLAEYKVDIVDHRQNVPALLKDRDVAYVMDPMPLLHGYPPPEKTILGLRNEFLFREHPGGANGLYDLGFVGRCVSLNRCNILHMVNRHQMEVFKNVAKQKLMLAQHGVDEQIFDKSKYKKPINDILTVGVSGRSTKNKGFGLVKAACDKVGAKFVMTEYYSKLPKEKMPEFYNNLDVFCCMSLNEGEHNPTLEAGSMGVPVISSRCGAAEEMIKDGVNGFLIDRNVDALCVALNKIKDKNLRENMGNEFFKEINNNWTWKVRIEDFRKMFGKFFEK